MGIEIIKDVLKKTTSLFPNDLSKKAGNEYCHYSKQLPGVLVEKLNQITGNSTQTLGVALLSTIIYLMHRYTSNEEISIGYKNNLNMLPIYLSLNNETTYHELLLQVKNLVQNDYKLKEEALTCNTLVEIVQREISVQQDGDFNFQMRFQFIQVKELNELKCNITYNSDLYSHKYVSNILNNFIYFLQLVIADYNIPLKRMDIVSSEERDILLNIFNEKLASFNKELTISSLFEKQVEKYGLRTAVSYENLALTYEELNAKAEYVAASIQFKGIRSGDIVGIMLNRSLDMIVCVLAVLKLGAAYLPLDPNLPDERVNYMLSDSGAKLVIVNDRFVQYDVNIDFVNLLSIEDSLSRGYTLKLHQEELDLNPENLAYVIYTSGTTGKPKGVQISHRNVIQLLCNDENRFDFNEQDIWTMFHSFSFDFSIWEMYGALLYGGKLIIVSDPIARDPLSFANLLEREQVTVLNQTPTYFLSLLNYGFVLGKINLSLRYIIFGGEALNPLLIKPFKDEYPEVKLINMYGITETTVHVTYKELDNNSLELTISNIGTPLPTLQVYVFDANQNLCPINVVGELYVAGAGVSKGYLNLPDITEEKFSPCPFLPGSKMYKTGDLVKWLPNGELQYIGRSDQQVKVRGYRIEVGEIEIALAAYESILEAAVIVDANDIGDKFLSCYYVAGSELNSIELKKYLETMLPSYMIPSSFIAIEKIPVTNNGKVDRKKLSLMGVQKETTDDIVDSESNLSKKLAQIWVEVLKTNVPHLEANFFDSGGDSIRVIRLVTQINKAFGSKIGVTDIYKNPTFGELSRIINNIGSKEFSKKSSVTEVINHQLLNTITKNNDNIYDVYPMSNIQQSMIYHSLLSTDEAIYHDQFVFPVEVVNFRYDTLKNAMIEIQNKHEILRTTFDIKEQMQLVHHNLEPIITFDDISMLRNGNQKQLIEIFLQEDLDRRYLFSEILWRMKIYQLSPSKVLIIISCHHAILDGWSIASLYTELLQCYNELLTKGTLVLKPLKSTYKDYVTMNVTESSEKGAEAFWPQFMDGYSRNKLPFNYSNKRISHVRGRSIKSTSLGLDFYQRLVRYSINNECTVRDLCLSAYLYLLHVISTEKDVVTGVVTHNRPAIEDGEKLLGCFLNTLPFRFHFDDMVVKKEFIESVRDIFNTVKSNDIFLADISGILGESSNGRNNPIFDTLFNFMDFHVLDSLNRISSINGSQMDFKLTRNEMTNTLFDFEILKTPDYFGVQIKYAPAYFFDSDINQAVVLYERILESFINQEQTHLEYSNLIMKDKVDELVYGYNKTMVSYHEKLTLHKIVEQQAKRTPHNTAIICNKKEISYNELNCRANKLARLIQSYGLTIGDRVGVCLERSADMIVALLAILKAGAAYVPMEPEYPFLRKKNIIANAQIKYMISDEAIDNVIVIDIDDTNHFESSDLNLEVDGNELAYIIYTSGSTGSPKGVMIEHHSVINLISWVNRTFSVTKQDTLLLVTSVCFDLSVYDIFGILSVGGKVVLTTKDETRDLFLMKEMIIDYQITFWDSTPSTLNQIIQLMEGESRCLPNKLRLAFLSGDWIPVNLPKRINKFFPDTKVISLGGATECTIWSNYHNIDFNKEYFGSIPYGKPIDNNSFYILNENQELVPRGVTGELYIGGVGVARGYNGDEIKTKRSFFSNHLTGVGRIYKTGDMGRYLPDGEIEFLGRKDHQVKIRGYRIELGEIESKIIEYPGISEAVVTYICDDANNDYLCAYYSHKTDITTDLQQYLTLLLPNYMVPTCFMRLDRLPLTPNGKVNRANLPFPMMNVNNHERSVIPPATDLEKMLADIWKSIFRIENVGMTDNFFFDLGGHSLNVVTLISKIHKELDLQLSVMEIFSNPTLKELSKMVEQILNSESVVV